FYGILLNSEVRFNEVKIENLSFEAFTNPSSGVLNFSRLRPLNNNSQVVITNSFLGNALFFDCNFKSFNKFIIKDSHLLDINFSNTKWPKTISAFDGNKMKPYEDSTKDISYAQLRETFRQLKIA